MLKKLCKHFCLQGNVAVVTVKEERERAPWLSLESRHFISIVEQLSHRRENLEIAASQNSFNRQGSRSLGAETLLRLCLIQQTGFKMKNINSHSAVAHHFHRQDFLWLRLPMFVSDSVCSCLCLRLAVCICFCLHLFLSASDSVCICFCLHLLLSASACVWLSASASVCICLCLRLPLSMNCLSLLSFEFWSWKLQVQTEADATQNWCWGLLTILVFPCSLFIVGFTFYKLAKGEICKVVIFIVYTHYRYIFNLWSKIQVRVYNNTQVFHALRSFVIF